MADTVKLWRNKREREQIESAADLFSLIKAAEKLEKAYVRDVVSAKEYEPACQKLIAQFKTLCTSLRYDSTAVERFMASHSMECDLAKNRLLRSGMPATLEHGDAGASEQSAAVVAQTVQYFITAMDSLRINMTAVDQVHPLLNELFTSLCRVPNLTDSQGKSKVKEWQRTLEGMRASDELSEEQVGQRRGGEEEKEDQEPGMLILPLQTRQLLFDLETSYNEFMASLPAGQK